MIRRFQQRGRQMMPRPKTDLGVCYRNGEGVKKDPTEAVELYIKAANQEYVDAQYALGIHYAFRVKKTEAVKWFRKAADQGYEPAQELLEWYP